MHKINFVTIITIIAALANVIANAEIEKNDNDIYIIQLRNEFKGTVEFQENPINMTMEETRLVPFTIRANTTAIKKGSPLDFSLSIEVANEDVVTVSNFVYKKLATFQNDTITQWSGNFTVNAVLLGHTRAYILLNHPNQPPQRFNESLGFIVTRKEGIMDTVFKVVVTSFVMVLYVNFGAVLELDVLKKIILRPIGPSIGLVGQFVVMPLVAFAIGYILFYDLIELRLGLFFTGASPAGGASNLFTVILNGNLNLSITMTALSNLAAFAMMPFWIFTLGSLIFRDGNLMIPYKTIAMMSCSLILPLSAGIALQIYAPKIAAKMAKLLKPLSLLLIIAITIFAFTVNSFFFKLFTLKIILASCALPWIGYLAGWLMAVAFRQTPADALTIAIETGIQNAGIAIFMLIVALPQPEADMTSAVPVATGMMTPIPLFALYVIRKFLCRTRSIEEVEEAPTKIAKEIEVQKIVEHVETTTPVK